jgi:hypothetical protein
LQYTDGGGVPRQMTIGLSARGNSRLDVCDYPPLQVTIDREQANGTVFAGQHRLKMVTTCRGDRDAANWLLLEYGIYRAYNVITDYSYRVRRVEVTFHDSEAKRWERKQTAFFIEPTDEAAERLQREEIRPPRVNPEQFSKTQTAHNSLFQFLIANTDYAVKRGPSGEGCCHNGRVIATPGSENDWVVLPYDFDQAGLINTDYALPAEDFHIKSVRRRLYRGFCWHNEQLAESIVLFNARRDEIVAALLPDDLSKNQRGKAARYVGDFFDIVNDTERLQKQIIERCRGVESLEIRKTTTAQN